MTSDQLTMTQVCAAANSVIPVITLEKAADAEPLAEILADSGFPVLEITLRTAAGLQAIERLAKSHPEIVVGAGTVLTADQAAAAAEAGARFLVSPGFSDAVHVRCQSLAIPYLPGIATVTEAMVASDHDYEMLKLFPANVAGGAEMLKALNSVLPGLAFCPTGGIDEDCLVQFLDLPNVACVGGSWLAPSALIRKAQWSAIRALAGSAAAKIPQSPG